MSRDEAAQQIFELHKRHAQQMWDTLVTIVRDNAELVISTDYPVNSLLAAAAGRNATLPIHKMDAGKSAPKPSVKGRVNVDCETFSVEHNSRRCVLNKTREFDLLERLNRRPGVYIPVKQLIDDVRQDHHTTTGTVQATACNLRRKLKEADVSGIVIEGKRNPGHYALLLTSE